MPGIVVVGAQWGDEGKGKVVDVFAEKADMVIRYQGGSNAGHTLVVNGKKTVLHLLPSGVLRPDTLCAIAPGVVVDIYGLVDEIKGIRAAGFLQNPKQLMISETCSVILPFHKTLDQFREKQLDLNKIGTTGKGIGPAYEDRAARRAVLFSDLFDEKVLREKLTLALAEKNSLFTNLYGSKPVSVDETVAGIAPLLETLSQYRSREFSLVLSKYLKSGKRILFEGAQGTLLDVWHGTYPFVTSSSTLAANACVSSGIGPMAINKIIGVFKAYTTRVGSGPFPTELNDDVGERLRKEGAEFGATTGRPRRCGWLDLVALRTAIKLNGITNLAMMKLDVLSGHDRIGVCTGYKIRGETVTDLPLFYGEIEHAEPIFEYLPGWQDDLSKITNLKDLPRMATNYLDFLGSQLGTPIDVISVGPGREQTLWVKPLFSE